MGKKNKADQVKESTAPASEGNETMTPDQAAALPGLPAFEKGLDAALDKAAAKTGAGKPADLTLPDNPVTPGERVRSTEDWINKQITNAIAAGDNWLRGVLSPRKNPITEGIKAEGKYQDKLKASMAEGRRVKGLEQVNIEAMYETIEAGGSTVYTSGVERRRAKIAAKVAKLQPMVKALAEQLDKMPQDTDAQREAKMIAAKRGMQAIGKKMRGIS